MRWFVCVYVFFFLGLNFLLNFFFLVVSYDVTLVVG